MSDGVSLWRHAEGQTALCLEKQSFRNMQQQPSLPRELPRVRGALDKEGDGRAKTPTLLIVDIFLKMHIRLLQ